MRGCDKNVGYLRARKAMEVLSDFFDNDLLVS